MQHAVRVDGLSKQYRLGARGGDGHPTLRDVIVHAAGAPWRAVRRLASGGVQALAPAVGRTFWALKDVSFDVEPGEVVGIVGRNGAGKSTLLKILSRVVEPSEGYCQLRGRLGSLLEVGTGFHPELTGRENVYLNGSILGMARSEIVRKFDEIVAFAEIEQFLDTTVKRYSSGMYVRLAFAVAAHLEPEILVVDEVLAVGDANFQRKCLGKMKDVAGHGRTILFVSHDMSAVRRLCNRVVLLEKGKVAIAGPTEEVVSTYMGAETAILRPGVPRDLTTSPRACGSGDARFLSAVCHGEEDGTAPVPGGPLRIELEIRSENKLTIDSLGVWLTDRSGLRLVNADTISLGQPIELQPGLNRIALRIERLHLNPGTYGLNFWLAKRPATVFDQIELAGEVEVIEPLDSTRIAPAGDGVVPCEFRLVGAGEPAGRSA
jgi:ABC-type polysaccharide/polyol phosphate transport system ATPase subunit